MLSPHYRLFGIRYNAPLTQVALLGLIFFCTVGIYVSSMGLGAGGTQNVVLADKAAAIMFGCFALTGLVSGSILNVLGLRWSLFIGSLGYLIYVAALWCTKALETEWTLLVAGAILGVCAALFWTAQGTIMLSYTSPSEKGLAFTVFWILYTFGIVVGSAVAVGLNANSQTASISTAVYPAFLTIVAVGCALTWLILPADMIVRSDTTTVRPWKSLGLKAELRESFKLYKDWKMLCLAPFFFSIDLFFAYFGVLNTTQFNGRTRAFNGFLAGAGPIFAALLLGVVHDRLPCNRRKRAFCGLALVATFVMVTWGGGLAFQLGFTRQTPVVPKDWEDPRAAGPIALLMSYWNCEAVMHGMAYFILGALTDDPARLSRMTSFYKTFNAAGMVLCFTLDAAEIPFLAEHLLSWFAIVASLPLVALVIGSIDKELEDSSEPVLLHGIALGFTPVCAGEVEAVTDDRKDGKAGLGV